MRAQFGDLNANVLSQYLDPPCLNKLLGRHYISGCQRVRKCATSHCWNPLCGRWAYKAMRGGGTGEEDAAAGGGGGMMLGRRAIMRRHQLVARLNEHGNGLAAAQVLEAVAAEGDGDGDGGNNDDDNDDDIVQRRLRNNVMEPVNASDSNHGEGRQQVCQRDVFSIESLLPRAPTESAGSGKWQTSRCICRDITTGKDSTSLTQQASIK